MPLNFVAKAAIQLGVMAAGMAMNAMRKIEGPRLDDLKFTSGDYGSPLAMVWGKRRLQCPIFWAEDLKEVKQQRKTKGGKYNEYTYFGTFAVALAGHEISGVTRVWFDTHLVFDLTGAGPVTPFDFGDGQKSTTLTEWRNNHPLSSLMPAIGGKGTNYFAFYYGTETQEPDPRIQATVEEAHGEGSCPAYRGTAYMVLKDVPLEKLGNRIPQVSVEVVSNPAASYPAEQPSTAPRTGNLATATFSPDFSRLMWSPGGSQGHYEIWDVAARARMISGNLPSDLANAGIYPSYAVYAVKSDGSFYAVSQTGGDIYLVSPEGAGANIQTFAHDQDEARVVADGNGTEHWGTVSPGRWFYFDGVEYNLVDITGQNIMARTYFTDAYGDVWVACCASGVTSTAYFYRLVKTSDRGGADLVTVSGLASLGSGSHELVAAHHKDGAYDQFVLGWDGDYLYAIDIDDGAVLDSEAMTLGLSAATSFAALRPGAASIWLNNKEISLGDFSTLRTVTYSDWDLGASVTTSIYDPINHALITGNGSDEFLTWRYLDRLTGDGVTLETIAADVSDMVGVQDYSFTALDQIVDGWSATQGQGSNMLEPLFDAYASDIAPHDFTIRGVKRSGVSTGTLATERFAKDQGPRYTLRVRQASELPKALVYNFADTNGDQQPNNVRVSRPLDATDASDERTIDLTTFASNPDTMRGLSDRHFRYMWNGRKEASFGLTFQQLAIEPTDVKTPTFDDESFTARCVKTVIRANGVMATEWVYDSPSLALTDGATGAAFDGRNPSVIVVPLISKGFVLDIPLLTDADNSSNPQVYIAAAPYAAGAWPGAVVYQAIDGEYSDEVGSIASSGQAAWGYTTDALPDANPWLWDRGSSVNVQLQVGSLTGTTEAAVDANAATNLILIGDEILNFATATLEGDGTYTLSGLKRGRRGTEWACPTHATRDIVLLLNAADGVDMGLSEVGTSLSFKVITSGRTEAGTFPIAMAPFTGASLKPYAPCHLEAVKESNGDWTLSWVRRTRVGGAWTSGTSIPLSEASEEYTVTVGDGVSSDAKTVTSAATYTWTVATQTTDTGAEVMAGDLEWSVAQVSDAVGDGFLAEATA